jgi:hypothetical protein
MEGMVMKKEYFNPTTSIISLHSEMIICTSGVNPDSIIESFEEPEDFIW